MGVINVTPDSFFAASRSHTIDHAVATALDMQAAGAAMIDIGGASSRPGAAIITVEDELSRVIPIISKLAVVLNIPISIDTYQPEVMQAAVDAGASIINDIYALQQPKALATAAKLAVKVCLMHMLGSPPTMQHNPRYHNVLSEVRAFFAERINACLAAGIARDKIIIDPGFGFGKTYAHNLTLLKNLNQLQCFNLPILVGLSRKSFFAHICTAKPDTQERLPASIASAIWAYQNGAQILRVHDVAATKQALEVAAALHSLA